MFGLLLGLSVDWVKCDKNPVEAPDGHIPTSCRPSQERGIWSLFLFLRRILVYTPDLFYPKTSNTRV